MIMVLAFLIAGIVTLTSSSPRLMGYAAIIAMYLGYLCAIKYGILR